MAQPSGTPGGPIAGINVTPLVDITLVLLIIFMVTAKLMVRQQALDLELPRAATGQVVQEVFSLALFASGAIALDGQPLAGDGEVLAHARRAHARYADLRAVIAADAGVAHGRVMHVLDLLRQAGISRIGFGVVPSPPPGHDVGE
jgi:biopolymer transport protein ExbD